jgi:alpha-glucosidase
VVPNHSSEDHVWFQEALKAGKGSKERERYIFRDGMLGFALLIRAALISHR